jgi:hypothetical protein
VKQVAVRKLKFDGSVKYRWPGDLVELRNDWAVVHHDPARHVKEGLETGDGEPAHLIHYIGLAGPVSVLFAYGLAGELLDAKCDAAFPGVVSGDRIDFLDLDLDVVVLPGGQHYVRDQDVFAERCVSMGYSEEARRTAHLGILHGLRMIRRGLFPFDGHAEALVRGLLSGTARAD